jgi:hypothetical protein
VLGAAAPEQALAGGLERRAHRALLTDVVMRI